MVREISGAKINQYFPLKIRVRKIGGGGNYASKYGTLFLLVFFHSSSYQPRRAGTAQSVWQLATSWTVRGSNPGGGEFFRTRPDQP